MRQGEPDAYLIIRHLGANVPVMTLNQLLDDGEADTCSSMFTGTRLFTPVEAFEDERKVFFAKFAGQYWQT